MNEELKQGIKQGFVRRKSSTTIKIVEKRGRAMITKSFSVLTEKDPDTLLERFKLGLQDAGAEKKIGLVVVKGKAYKMTTIINDLTPSKLAEEAKRLLLSCDDCFDAKSSRFSIVVRNKYSLERDDKRLLINSELSFPDLADLLKDRLKLLMEEVARSDIQFIGEDMNHRGITHQVSLIKRGRQRDTTKSWSVRFPNYSSNEIVGLITGSSTEDEL